MTFRTEVCITIDTEFSIAGHFDDPDKYLPVSTPAVTCPVSGKEHGLGFLLDTFTQYDTAATFFIETANQCYFGDEANLSIAKRIKAASQDLQLHVHPVWLSLTKHALPIAFPRNDNCAERDFDALKAAFNYCVQAFERIAGKRPDALRTGSLWADINVYKVMSDLGIPLASNIGLGVYRPPEPSLQLHSGRHLIEGVMELPILSYQDFNVLGRKQCKTLQITSCSWPEMKHILKKARANGIETVVILTHPFEFIKKADFQYKKLTQNRVNQNRLTNLCRFIKEHDQDFVSMDFSKGKDRWLSSTKTHPYMKIPSHFSVIRKLHNKINDSIWHY